MRTWTSVLLLVLSLTAACERPRDEIRFSAQVKGDLIHVRALSPGRVVNLPVRLGQVVKIKDRLVELDRRLLDKTRDELVIHEREIQDGLVALERKRALLSRVVIYRQELTDKLQRLREGQNVSGDQFEQARLGQLESETALAGLEAEMQALRHQRERLKVKLAALDVQEETFMLSAPVSGPILDLFVGSGEAVVAGMELMSLLDQSSLHLEGFIEGGELDRLGLGKVVGIRIDGSTDGFIRGTVSQLAHRAEFSPRYVLSEKERQALLYRVRIDVAEADRSRLKLGMPVTVELLNGPPQK